MYNYLNSIKSNMLIFTTATILGLALLLSLPGCQPAPATTPVINLDSAKAHVIPIGQARRWAARFRAVNDSLKKKCQEYKDSLWLPRAEAFNSDIVSLLLSQKDSTGAPAAGIRVYYGLDEKGICRMILLPYDKNYNDIINRLIVADDKPVPGVSAKALESGEGGQAGETGQQCPTVCSAGSL